MPILNIGENTNDGRTLTLEKVVAALHLAGALPNDLIVYPSDSELTYVVKVPRTLSTREVADLAIVLDQDAIAYAYGEERFLAGPHADKWQPFNPEFFLTLDGHRLSDHDAAIAA